MAQKRSYEFLPEVFQTETNKKLLAATLDQLVSEPVFKKTQGFVGRRLGAGIDATGSYVVETSKQRQDYQLEPGVVFLKTNTQTAVDAITYPGLLDTVTNRGGDSTHADQLFASESYSWDPLLDLDKFVNFSQYYWLPGGPNPVDVVATEIAITGDFTVTRESVDYKVSAFAGANPVVTLVRGGSYTFTVNQDSEFWIQSAPGIEGVLPITPNISSRDVYGVVNNGAKSGKITFNVPTTTDQNFFYSMPVVESVDLVTDLKFNQVNGQFVQELLANHSGIDNVQDLNGRTIIFQDRSLTVDAGGWYQQALFDNSSAGFDAVTFDQSTAVTSVDQRYGVWKITYVYDANGENPYISLTPIRAVDPLTKFKISYGTQWSNYFYYKTASGYFDAVPLLTSLSDVLYYQDGTNPDIKGTIKLGQQTIDIADIVGKTNYTSPNGVVFTNGLKVQFRGEVVPSSYTNQQYYVYGVGTAISLVPVTAQVTPETYTESGQEPFDINQFDINPFDQILNQPLVQDYITIHPASIDLNAWSRSNRWFHVDVIIASANYNNTSVIIDNNYRARRPIIEFNPNLKLFNMGIVGKTPVNVIDFTQTDAFSNVNGQTTYSVDGYEFITGTRIIFAADPDPLVAGKIFQVEFINPHGTGNIINLVEAADTSIVANESVVILDGLTLQGNTYLYTGTNWVLTQQKTAVNQSPVFDVFDINGVSFSDPTVYPSSSFRGSKLFSYRRGTGSADAVLKFPLSYLNINNVGDIVFDNNFYTDSFISVNNKSSSTKQVSDGYVHQYSDLVNYTPQIGWQTSAGQVQSVQVFDLYYSSTGFNRIDVVPKSGTATPAVKLYINNVFLNPTEYSYTVDSTRNLTTFSFVTPPADGTPVLIEVISDQVSDQGHYRIPVNLEFNPYNANAESFTLGTVRTHYNTIAQNLTNLTGTVNGANNIRDLGNTIPYGKKIVQHSSPVVPMGLFSRDPDLDIIPALEFASREYEKFKNKLLTTFDQTDVGFMSVPDILDLLIQQINQGKVPTNPFYWSDMIPNGTTFKETSYTVTTITTNIFSTLNSYDFTQANYSAILVYLNDQQLVRGQDYNVATDGPRIELLRTLVSGDVIKIREYTTTVGNFIPATPSKLGLYPLYLPEITVDTTYITPQTIIRGHDGSVTMAYGDLKDQILLEFELRIYNNIKVSAGVPMSAVDVMPGQFRNTGYSQITITEILASDFLSWVSWNRLDYKTQTYIAGNPFTYNYSTATNKLDGETMVGSWRGIYQYFYDTTTPHTTPWEMLGFTIKPAWWDNQYGTVPYTSGNMVLWSDLEAGIVKDPAGYYTLAAYARPGLSKIIPVDTEGNLLDPLVSVVKNYNDIQFRKSWTVGDKGPVETAWNKSSAYAFSIQKLLILTRPAKYFSLMIDMDQYRYNTKFQQYLFKDRYRLNPAGLTIYGNGTAKHSYINWIVDYSQQSGASAYNKINTLLNNFDVRLCYRMASFTDKTYMNLLLEKTNPNSANSSFIIPAESYNLLLYKNPAFDHVIYSSVMVQATANGYSVVGNSIDYPYFEIAVSVPNGNYSTISSDEQSVRLAQTFTNQVVKIPYGYEFTTIDGVADFLNSYGHLLTQRGMVFDAVENGITINMNQMIVEFLNWNQQGWEIGSAITLNPGAQQLKFSRAYAVADSLVSNGIPTVLNQNRLPIDTNSYVVDRLDNDLTVKILDNNTIGFIRINLVSYEHMIILDNVSVFADLMYQAITGDRQSRISLSGYNTFNWNGQLNSQGFILNQDNVREWQPNAKYTKGEIVLYKNSYWSSTQVIEPSESFNFSYWVQSNYNYIDKGLLPNLSNKAKQITQFYDNKTTTLNADSDLLGFGLTGYRSRDYMTSLNLDPVSQVNLYSSFLKNKGTKPTAELFTRANLGKESATYEIFENWAVQRGTYGASANRTYFEILLNDAVLNANPAVIAVISPGTTVEADQTVYLNQLYKQSVKYTNSNIMPTTVNPLSGFPSAGYVNQEDATIEVFDFDALTTQLNYTSLGIGTTVWVAKVNNHDWDIYRCNRVPTTIVGLVDNLDGRSIISFAGPHNLSVDEYVVIRFLSPAVDGTYQVQAVPSLDTIVINFSLNGNQVKVDNAGVAFNLSSIRVKSAEQIANLSWANDLVPGDRVWVDKNAQGLWSVLVKQEPFVGTAYSSLPPATYASNLQFGASVAQTNDNVNLLAGAPGYNSGAGTLFNYARTTEGYYDKKGLIDISSWRNYTGVLSLGFSTAIGNDNWGITGAPASYTAQGAAFVLYRSLALYQYGAVQQLIALDGAAGDQFGYSVTMSTDNRWVYVGAPGANKVYAYQLIQHPGSGTSVVLHGNGSTVSYDITSLLPNSTTPSSVLVSINGVVQRPGIEYTMTSPGVLYFVVAPAIDFTVSAVDHYEQVGSAITVAGLGINDQFGFSVNCTSDGRQLMVGAPGADNNHGKVYVFDRGVENLIVADAEAQSITATVVPAGDVRVYLNGALQTNSRWVTNGDYTISGAVLTFTGNNAYPAPGGVGMITGLESGQTVTIETNNFNLVQAISPTNASAYARFGQCLDIDLTDGAVYIGAPNDSTTGPFNGSVERFVDQARRYGSIVSTGTVSAVTPGNSIRINGINIQFSGSTVESVVQDILDAGNITLLDSTDPAVQARYLGLGNVTASNVNGLLQISAVNTDFAEMFNRVVVLPGLSNLNDQGFAQLKLTPFVWTQSIYNPTATDYGYFGNSLYINSTDDNLIVSAPNANQTVTSTWIKDGTTFDANSTRFQDHKSRTGTVFSFDYLAGYNETAANPGQLVIGQQIYTNQTNSQDQFGSVVNFTGGVLVISATGTDAAGDANVGTIYLYNNLGRQPSWLVSRTQQPSVRTELLSSAFIYSTDTQQVVDYLDWVDPQRGKILGVAAENIDFQGGVDPAYYNQGSYNNYGRSWKDDSVGKIWWDTSRSRFLDYDQGTPVYASRVWGTLFPGSSIDIYQWVESSTPPASYTGPGTVYSTTSYSQSARLNNVGTFEVIYYFWVTGLDTVNSSAGKTLSTNTISNYISSPKSSGISYFAPLRTNVVAIYNTNNELVANTSVLNIEYNQIKNTNPIHIEYELIPEGSVDGFLSADLYQKMIDSFCGTDTAGNLVPDPTLNLADRYGISVRPRQSMFKNRLTALKNYIQRVNSVLVVYPIAEMRTFNLLNSAEPYPSQIDASRGWNYKVANLTELGYQNLSNFSAGIKFLVESDSDSSGRWAIYIVNNNGGVKSLSLFAVQTYDTRFYWSYQDWYAPGILNSISPSAEVQVYADLSTLSLSAGSVAKVKTNSQGKWELYQLDATGAWSRIALELGTIQIDAGIYDYTIGKFGFDSEVFDAQYFDQEPTLETREIIRSINEELLIGELLLERNSALTLMFNYILSESLIPDWLFKTSLIDVNHTLRALSPYPLYKKDNQDFVLQYITEVKPYHVQIREFNLLYDGTDIYSGSATDFDLPSAWNTSLQRYISPQLDNNLYSVSSYPDSAPIWTAFPYNQWYNNYKLIIETVKLVDGGAGYTVAPTVTAVGTAVRAAKLTSRINSVGQVIAIDVVDAGEGYSENVSIVISGGNGYGARASAVMGINLVRNFHINMKYDRYEYKTSVSTWTANTSYDNGVLVRENNTVYRADCNLFIKITDIYGNITSDNIHASKLVDYHTIVNIPIGHITAIQIIRNGDSLNPFVNGFDFVLEFDSNFSTKIIFANTSVDKSPGTVNIPAFDVTHWSKVDPATLSGVDRTMGLYTPSINEPGLQLSMLISGVEYPGVNVFGPSFNPGDDSYGLAMDAIYSSSYTDSYLGTRVTDINVDGAGFVDVYNSYAPEELIPGSSFDTLDMRVYTRPGADWSGQGFGWPTDSLAYFVANGGNNTVLSFANSHVTVPATIIVKQLTIGATLYENQYYTIDWQNKTITLLAGASSGSYIGIDIYGIGGGNQLEKLAISGSDLTNNSYVLPVTYAEVYDIVIYHNGQPFANFTSQAHQTYSTQLNFVGTYSATDYFAITVLGAQPTQYEYSVPYREVFTYDGSNNQFAIAQSTGGSNPVNMMVEVNGFRLRPPSGYEYYGDGTTAIFATDSGAEIAPGSIADNEIHMYVDDVPLNLGRDFVVNPWDGIATNRTVTLTNIPSVGSRVLIAVSTSSDYQISNNLLRINNSVVLKAGDRVSVLGYTDTRQEALLTRVYKGPTTGTQPAVITFDQVPFDYLPFDSVELIATATLVFDLERVGVDVDKVWVSINGKYLVAGDQYVVANSATTSILTLSVASVSVNDIIAVTIRTGNLVPDALSYRVYHDMRGNRTIARITDKSTTKLTQALQATDDIIYLDNASNLSEPNLPNGQFGLITIGGERITYRTRDTINNTISGLRRGTAGSGTATHAVGALVYDIGKVNILPVEYQDITTVEKFVGNGSNRIFTTESLTLTNNITSVVQVTKGGTVLTSGYSVTVGTTVTVTLDTAPSAGEQITISILQGRSFYQPGDNTPSNGVSLQQTNTPIARYLRGL